MGFQGSHPIQWPSFYKIWQDIIRYYKDLRYFWGFTLLQVDLLMDVDGFRSAMAAPAASAAPAAPALASIREAWQNMIIWWLNSLLFFFCLLFFLIGVWRWLLIGVDTLEVKQATSNEPWCFCNCVISIQGPGINDSNLSVSTFVTSQKTSGTQVWSLHQP